MSELEPLDDDILAIVKSAQDVEEIAPARRESILAVTTARIGVATGGGGDGGPGGSASGGGGAGASLLAKFALATALFLAGIGAGIAIDRGLLFEPSPGRPPLGATAVPPVSPAASAAGPSLAAVSAASLPDAPRTGGATGATAASVAATPRGASAGEAPSSRGLAAERALLDVARSALARGEASEAFAATQRHAHEYPDGALIEEREAIAVKALVALGRMDEARSRAHALEQRFPNGLNVRAVRAAVGEAPAGP